MNHREDTTPDSSSRRQWRIDRIASEAAEQQRDPMDDETEALRAGEESWKESHEVRHARQISHLLRTGVQLPGGQSSRPQQ